jgi:antitoxin component of RelBE/YafQ-DinJ toxin-antitoxin module
VQRSIRCSDYFSRDSARKFLTSYTHKHYNVCMIKTILNIKTDPATKQQLQMFASELGVPVSVIINAQIKQMLRDRKVVLSTELEPTPYLVKIMEQVEEDLKSNKNMTKAMNTKEAVAYLKSL